MTKILGGLGALNLLVVLTLAIRCLWITNGSDSQKLGKGLCVLLGAFCVFWTANILRYDKSISDAFSSPAPSSLFLVFLLGIVPAVGFYAFCWIVHRFVINADKEFGVIQEAFCIVILSALAAIITPRFYAFFLGGESTGKSVGDYAMLGVLGGGFLYVIKMLLKDEM